jgi:hypothetical protein
LPVSAMIFMVLLLWWEGRPVDLYQVTGSRYRP